MTPLPTSAAYADDLPLDAGDDDFDEYTLEELERSADLGSVHLAMALGDARNAFWQD